MNHLRAYSRKLLQFTYGCVAGGMLLNIGYYILVREYLKLSLPWSVAATLPVVLLTGFIVSNLVSSQSIEGLQAIWQGIWHVSPGKENIPAPQLDAIHHGRALISSMVMQIYDLASQGSNINNLSGSNTPAKPAPTPAFDDVPVPIVILDKDKKIILANKALGEYLARPVEHLLGFSILDAIKMSFTDDATIDKWIEDSRESRATDTRNWEHVRVQTGEAPGSYHQCDIVATYSKGNTAGHETVLVLYDRSKFYNQQDNGMSYIALAVHELRTPLTILRGYIEVFEDELDPQLTPELREFMRKMSAAAQSLTAFVSNILNVARIDENQLVLSLHETNWNELLPEIIEGLQLRAHVRGKTIELEIQPGLPTVAADKISIYEVVSNLVDNAVKYSGPSPKVIVRAGLAKDGSIETVVQDFGAGLPANQLSGLFTKYYRSHRQRNAVSGSGLGLYLVKAMVTAHGGRVWAESQENKGSSFGFSLQPYSAVASESSGSNGIERQASGWIKNHSIYR